MRTETHFFMLSFLSSGFKLNKSFSQAQLKIILLYKYICEMNENSKYSKHKEHSLSFEAKIPVHIFEEKQITKKSTAI